MKEQMGMHTTNRPNKTGAVSKLGEMGTSMKPNMDHEGDISLGEGLEHGAVHTAHIKHSVAGVKHVTGLTEISRGHQDRLKNGNANPHGERPVAAGKSGKAMMAVEDKSIQGRRMNHMENERHEDEAQNHDTFMSEL